MRLAPAGVSVSTRFFPVVVAIWRAAKGEEVPRPRLPIVESKKNSERPPVPKRTVEEAKRLFWNQNGVEVADVVVPKVTWWRNASLPPPLPQAAPVEERSPVALNCAHVVPELPALETRRLVVLAVVAVMAVVDA